MSAEGILRNVQGAGGGLGAEGRCQPTKSTYAGPWYDFVW